MRNLVRFYQHIADVANATVNVTNKNSTTGKPPMSAHTKKIIAIVVLSLLGALLLILAVWFYIKRKRAYEDYNKRPETFIRKPSDSQIQRIEESE
jgi:LPXTG-motif cell wall-anchored protein